MLRFLSAGESHGPCLTGIIEGLPSGIALSEQDFDRDLAKRQAGYGRGGRMAIEQDRARITAGVSAGRTTGAPLALAIENRDWANWRDREIPPLTVPRPGHADLPGALKYGLQDMRAVLERASARETAIRVAIGVVAKKLAASFGIQFISYVEQIGECSSQLPHEDIFALADIVDRSPVRCPDTTAERAMIDCIDRARTDGDSLGGTFTVIARGVPPGLGSHVHWDRRLDGQLARAVMSIPAIKGVEIGLGFACASRPGSLVHDQMVFVGSSIRRLTNNAGGLEGGMTNGEDLIIRAAMKPIPTLLKSMQSVDITTKKAEPTKYERSDVCAVPAASIVAEAMVAWEIASALAEVFGGNSIADMISSYSAYLDRLEGTWKSRT